MMEHIPAPGTQISAHRLWTTLWKDLGQPEENISYPGGNQQATGEQPEAFHTAATGTSRPATGPVDSLTATTLQERRMSPASTDPMTTTFL